MPKTEKRTTIGNPLLHIQANSQKLIANCKVLIPEVTPDTLLVGTSFAFAFFRSLATTRKHIEFKR